MTSQSPGVQCAADRRHAKSGSQEASRRAAGKPVVPLGTGAKHQSHPSHTLSDFLGAVTFYLLGFFSWYKRVKAHFSESKSFYR